MDNSERRPQQKRQTWVTTKISSNCRSRFIKMQWQQKLYIFPTFTKHEIVLPALFLSTQLILHKTLTMIRTDAHILELTLPYVFLNLNCAK